MDAWEAMQLYEEVQERGEVSQEEDSESGESFEENSDGEHEFPDVQEEAVFRDSVFVEPEIRKRYLCAYLYAMIGIISPETVLYVKSWTRYHFSLSY